MRALTASFIELDRWSRPPPRCCWYLPTGPSLLLPLLTAPHESRNESRNLPMFASRDCRSGRLSKHSLSLSSFASDDARRRSTRESSPTLALMLQLSADTRRDAYRDTVVSSAPSVPVVSHHIRGNTASWPKLVVCCRCSRDLGGDLRKRSIMALMDVTVSCIPASEANVSCIVSFHKLTNVDRDESPRQPPKQTLAQTHCKKDPLRTRYHHSK